jgi:hypothetical protein
VTGLPPLEGVKVHTERPTLVHDQAGWSIVFHESSREFTVVFAQPRGMQHTDVRCRDAESWATILGDGEIDDVPAFHERHEVSIEDPRRVGPILGAKPRGDHDRTLGLIVR